MLTKLFNSQTKVKIIQYLLSNHGVVATTKEIAKKTHLSLDVTRTTCLQLSKLGVFVKDVVSQNIEVEKKKTKEKGYRINTEFPLYKEIQALFIKSQLLFEGDLVKKMKKIGGAMFIVITGVFTTPDEESTTDLLIVGKINRDKLSKLISSFERKLGFEINYTVMTRSEYTYRRDITDRFLYSILEGEHITILDKLYDRR